jgi:diguanylate cyclase
MQAQVDILIRGPEAFRLARQALDELERRQIWPTPLNLELWLHFLSEPEGALAQEISRILDTGEPFTDAAAETLAANYLPRARLSEQIRDAGAQLSRELKSVATAIRSARKSQEAYGRTLAGASQDLQAQGDGSPAVLELVETLAQATRKVQSVGAGLEKRLQDSTLEVSKLREHLEQVRRDAMTDALTNLANRKAFDEHLARFCREAAEGERALSIAVIDIDHFKRFNDTWGHQTGDQVLRFVASVIGKLATGPRIAARYGGEEFALIFPGISADRAGALVETMREQIASRILKRRSTNEDLGEVTISAGVAQLRSGETMACLMERADAALYASKRAGRNRVTSAEGAAKAA